MRMLHQDMATGTSAGSFCLGRIGRRSGQARKRKATRGDDYIQLEIQAGTLRRLIQSNQVFVEEIHSVGARSKTVIKEALMDSVVLNES